MADAGATVAGLKEAYVVVEKLPETVTTALKSVARQTADRIAVNAAAILRSKTHGTGKTAGSIRVLDESDQKQYTVNVPGDSENPAALPGWLEYGTRYMSARPFLRPSGDAESGRYIAEMTAVAEKTLQDVLK